MTNSPLSGRTVNQQNGAQETRAADQQGCNMRRFPIAVALVFAVGFAIPVGTATTAQAFGDTCYRDVTARGSVQSSMSAARNSAIAAWESAVSRKHGARFGNWYYSIDRTFDCSWNNAGNRIKCLAVAGPCGRKR